MKTIKYWQILPGGNCTILINNLDGCIEQKEFAGISQQIIEDYLPCEQVGFICPPLKAHAKYRLEMMGGEFCINGLRSLAYLNNFQTGEKMVRLGCSGSKQSFALSVEENGCSFQNKMRAQITVLNKKLIRVDLPGITHFAEKSSAKTQTQISERFRGLLKRNKLLSANAEAIGYIPIRENDLITPLIYVPKTKTTIFETACGSGSIAAALAFYPGELKKIYQPSNCIFKVNTKSLGNSTFQVSLSSPIQVLSEGVIYLR